MTTHTTVNQISPLPKAHFVETALRTWYLVCDSSHQVNALEEDFNDKLSVSESLLPQIRLVATLIAAARHDFADNAVSPAQFTEEADWFAARILVLKIAFFHLDVSLHEMLRTANARAQAFANKHQLAFEPAQAKLSLHAGRPQSMLIMETALGAEDKIENINIIRNSQKLARLLPATII